MNEVGVVVGDLFGQAVVGLELWGQAEGGGRSRHARSEEGRSQEADSAEKSIAGTLPTKRRGEVAEAAFLLKAAGLGFWVAKPWGESGPYDFVVDAGGRLWRVQVKSAYRSERYGGYSFHAHGNKKDAVYSAAQVDLLVAYVVPEDAWYVVPITVFRKIKSMRLFPGSRRRRSKFEKYREGWAVMEGG